MAEHLAAPDVCGEAVKQKSQVNRRPPSQYHGMKEKALTYCVLHSSSIKKEPFVRRENSHLKLSPIKKRGL